jgi:phage shock protein A
MSTTTDLQPIDRLEEKVKQLVGMIETLRTDRTKALDNVAKLERDLDAATTRITELESTTVEAGTLREEREKIRNRVVEMISHIDKLNL